MNNINIKQLKPHPMNKDIYGEEDINELAEQIKKSNIITNLIINQDNVIISGHRRYYACLSLGKKEVPYEKIIFNNKNEELERLLLENQYRDKTTYQKIKEAEVWDKIETDKAEKRRLLNLKQNTDKDSGPFRESGQTRDILAEKVNLGSGKTYDRAKSAVKKIDELKEQGNEKDAEFLKTVLNDSVRGAKDLAELESLEDISDKIKDQVIKKEIPVQKAVQTIRKDLGIVTDNTKNNDKKEGGDEKVCSKCGQKKSILEFYTGRSECRDCHHKYRENNKVDMFEGIDMYALEADIKNPNKRADDYTYEDIIMEIEAAINSFAFSVNRYVNDDKSYEDMDVTNKNKLLSSIDIVETIVNILKNKLI
jgi:ParB-like chromosome segregation protein Spo0J